MVQILINIIASFGLILLIGYSFYCIYSTLRFFHLAHAATLTIGSYLTFCFSISLGLPLILSVILSVMGGVLVMFVVYCFLYKNISRYKTASWKMMVVSLGIYVVLQNIISMVWGDTRLNLRTWNVSVGHEVFGGYITNNQIISVIASCVLLSLVQLIITKTTIGRKTEAVSSNPEMSTILGISNSNVMAFSIGIGSALMASAGILIAIDIDMTPTMGFDWLMYGVVAMIIGGMGKMRYMILGALLLATAQQLSAYFLDSKLMNATAYIILVIFLYFRPFGFSGKKLKKTEV